jgi:hypothetical protein
VAGDDGDGIKTTNETNQKEQNPKDMKTKITVIAAIPALLLVVVGYAQEPGADAKAAVKRGPEGAIEVGAVTKTWKVTTVDPANRTVTLTNEAGASNTYEAGDRVRNLDQIKAGDEIKATLLESVAVAIRKSSAPADAAADRTTVAVAPKGAEPGAIMAKTKEITGKITSVDTTARTVTIEGPMGGTTTIDAGPDVKLDQFQTGDNVTLRVTVGLAVRTEKP